jgi:predicted negative regulator of RcsB-dependent stress response
MDDQQSQDQQNRQRKIESGVGLQESRLNEDFINFLNKWGGRVVWVLLIVVGGYLALQWYGRQVQQAKDAALAQYQSAVDAESITQLEQVAREHSGKRTVATLARLHLASLYNSVGTTRVGPDAEPGDPLLSAEEANAYFERAIEEARRVIQNNGDRPGFTQRARWTIATAQMSLGRADDARATLQEFIEVAERENLASMQLGQAQARLAYLDGLSAEPFPLIPVSALPAHAVPPSPEPEAPDAGTETFAPLGPIGPEPQGDDTDANDAESNDAAGGATEQDAAEATASGG